MAPTALPETAPIAERRKLRKSLNDVKEGLELTNGMKHKKLAQSPARRMELMDGESRTDQLTPTYK